MFEILSKEKTVMQPRLQEIKEPVYKGLNLAQIRNGIATQILKEFAKLLINNRKQKDPNFDCYASNSALQYDEISTLLNKIILEKFDYRGYASLPTAAQKDIIAGFANSLYDALENYLKDKQQRLTITTYQVDMMLNHFGNFDQAGGPVRWMSLNGNRQQWVFPADFIKEDVFNAAFQNIWVDSQRIIDSQNVGEKEKQQFLQLAKSGGYQQLFFSTLPSDVNREIGNYLKFVPRKGP